MGRQLEPLFIRDKIYYARFYEEGKRIILSLGTPDKIEANRRLPIVRNARMSWEEYQRTVSGYEQHPITTISSIGKYTINPPLTMPGTREGLLKILESLIANGGAKYDKETEEWSSVVQYGDPKSDSDVGDFLQEFGKDIQSKNDAESIKKFYEESIPPLYTDKKNCNRFSSIWLKFLSLKNITRWQQITESLCLGFKKWRESTGMPRHNNVAQPPSALVISRHITFLSQSFDLAVHKGLMQVNPIKFWKKESHQSKPKQGLTKEELKAVLLDPIWQQDSMHYGKNEIFLGYKLSDILLLLLLSCKRRSEILNLDISSVCFSDRYVSYVEEKNKSKKNYSVRKAFYITPYMEGLLRGIIGDRKTGLLFPVKGNRFNGSYFSELFERCIERVAPHKNTTLHCLRHSAVSIMEAGGLTDEEIDATLGHLSVKTALKYYQDRDPRSVALRVAGKTQKGLEVISKAVEEMLHTRA
jgi:integrase